MFKKDARKLREIIERNRPDLKRYEDLYREFHADPELSGQEACTASRIIAILNEHQELEVIGNLGGHGVVGVFKNGEGPVVLLRSELDALPLEELTGLPYASGKHMKDAHGEVVPVFHGCGHDMHMACLLAAVEVLLKAKSAWSGTLVALFQPAEETFEGAQAMVDDNLFDKIPRPSILLAQHSTKDKAGRLLISGGPILTACDSYDIRINGRGGHGSSPDHCLDPIITGAHVLTRLQTIVSREISPQDFAVVTCGSFKAGHTASIIPDTADLQLDLRALNERVMEKIKTAVERVVQAECTAAGMESPPDIIHVKGAPPTINDDHAAAILTEAFRASFGDAVLKMNPDTASEDFSLLARPYNIPYVYWDFGTTEPQKWDEAEKHNEVDRLPGNHSSHFCPVIEPSLLTGTDAMALAALTFLGGKA
ncbi:hypothetical protein AA0120_g10153 [Alternaria tenuissima]|nr:hypothetical protein AA0120_g10153 [Alternaria tenuissima]